MRKKENNSVELEEEGFSTGVLTYVIVVSLLFIGLALYQKSCFTAPLGALETAGCLVQEISFGDGFLIIFSLVALSGSIYDLRRRRQQHRAA